MITAHFTEWIKIVRYVDVCRQAGMYTTEEISGIWQSIENPSESLINSLLNP